jgi:AraC family transcriptional regulator
MPFQGGGDAIGPAWRALMRDWLPASGWQLDQRPCFERYPAGGGFDPATRTFVCDICIPVTPL